MPKSIVGVPSMCVEREMQHSLQSAVLAIILCVFCKPVAGQADQSYAALSRRTNSTKEDDFDAQDLDILLKPFNLPYRTLTVQRSGPNQNILLQPPDLPNLNVLLDPPEICYDVVGCFSNRAPWESLLRPVFPPRPPQQVSPYMYFHNRQTTALNGTKFQIYPEIDFSNVPFDVTKPTFLITHGYTESGTYPTSPRYPMLAKALLKRLDANVFILDYSASAIGVNYFQAVGDIRVAGRLGAIVMLKAGISPAKLHLIGHSLGAQLIAYTAKYLTEKKGKPARLTCLEPARQLFEIYSKEIKQDKNDAEFVDVVHTSIGRRGDTFPSGHVDFFVNGGIRQPGCLEEDIEKQYGYCSHGMSVILYTKSLERNGCIVGEKTLPSLLGPVALLSGGYINGTLPCNSVECVSMGLGIEKAGKTGNFYVPTSSPRPYTCNDKF